MYGTDVIQIHHPHPNIHIVYVYPLCTAGTHNDEIDEAVRNDNVGPCVRSVNQPIVHASRKIAFVVFINRFSGNCGPFVRAAIRVHNASRIVGLPKPFGLRLRGALVWL